MTQVIVYASTSICMWNSPFVWAGIEDEQTLAAVVASDSGRRNTELHLCEVGYSSVWSLKLHLFICLLTDVKFEYILISMQMRAAVAVWMSTKNLSFCVALHIFQPYSYLHATEHFFFLHKHSETDEMQWKERMLGLHDYMWSNTTGPGTLMKD